MNRRSAITIIGIAAAVAVGSIAAMAYLMPPQQGQSTTDAGLEAEQRGEVIPGEQPSTEGPADTDPLTLEGEETGTAGSGTGNQSGTGANTTGGGAAGDSPATPSGGIYGGLP